MNDPHPTQPAGTPAASLLRGSYPVVYMFTVTAIFCGLLITLAGFTHDRVEVNRRIFFERAVLATAGLAGPQTPNAEIHARYMESVREWPKTGSYRVYRHGELVGYALPFEGRGFWNRIAGIIGLTPDGTALTGLAIYEQSETPGLGAEIVTPRFTDAFRGLHLRPSSPALSLRPPGSELEPGDVHAITGATQTCTRLEDILNNAILRWRTDSGQPVP